MMEEVNMTDYFPLKNFEDLYFINRYGIIKKKKNYSSTAEDAGCFGSLKIVSGGIRGKYEVVSLTKDGICRRHTKHKLMAQTFIPNPDELPMVLHINRDGLDNRVENLRWVSRKDYYPAD
jgi:hypothetical protein